jgi:CRP/FNR family transcriptional regulator, dissimilatory nitrate respiration regulator
MDAFGLDEAPKSLRARLRHRDLAAGTALFRQGDPVVAVYVIERGRLAMVRHTAEGRRVTLFTAGPGESFAEAALFSEVYHCDAVAEVPSRVTIVPKAELHALLKQRGQASDRLMARLAHQVQALRTRLELRSIRSARERIWQALILAAEPGSRTVKLQMPLNAMAGEIGLTQEAFYRAIAALEAAGRIRRRGRRIDLLEV